MKQKDIALIAVIVLASGIVSFVVSHILFSGPKNRSVKAEVVDSISTDFTQPDKKYFNPNSIDPTEPVIIGTGSNAAPFTNGQ